MKRKIIPISLIGIIALLIFSSPIVSAADSDTHNSGNAASMEISYSLSTGEVDTPSTPDDSPEPSGTYTVIIPAAINLKQQQDFLIRAEDVSISTGNYLSVYIDGTKTFTDDGEFYIYNGGTDTYHRMNCNILRGLPVSSIDTAESVKGPNDILVAEFRDGDYMPCTYGRLFIQPSYYPQNVPGMYAGTLYFKIGIEND